MISRQTGLLSNRRFSLAAELCDLLVAHAFDTVGEGAEAFVNYVKFCGVKREAQRFAAIFQSVAATVFAQDKPAFGNADTFGVDDFVGGLFLQIAVLVNAGFVREGVFPDNGFVWLRAKADHGGEQLAAGVEMFGIDAGCIRINIAARFEAHYHFFKRRIAGTFPDAVDGAFHLTCASLDGSEGVGNGEPNRHDNAR